MVDYSIHPSSVVIRSYKGDNDEHKMARGRVRDGDKRRVSGGSGTTMAKKWWLCLIGVSRQRLHERQLLDEN